MLGVLRLLVGRGGFLDQLLGRLSNGHEFELLSLVRVHQLEQLLLEGAELGIGVGRNLVIVGRVGRAAPEALLLTQLGFLLALGLGVDLGLGQGLGVEGEGWSGWSDERDALPVVRLLQLLLLSGVGGEWPARRGLRVGVLLLGRRRVAPLRALGVLLNQG